jgi:hypothetical protein
MRRSLQEAGQTIYTMLWDDQYSYIGEVH